MSWPYQFTKLSSVQSHERRILLDRYGLYAQLSALIPIALALLVRLTRHILERNNRDFNKEARLTVKHDNKSLGYFLSTKQRQFLWWLKDDVEFAGLSLGQRNELILGGTWAIWLVFLCVGETGEDYFHLTKRFGIIGSSQFPIQYLLSLKRLNPIAFAFRTSHEDINRWHRLLGYITYFLVAMHGALYLNFYIQVGGLGHAFFRLVPVLGILGLFCMTLLSTTTLSVIRKYSYRLFFVTHILVALAVPPLIWFHVPHARVFMAESLLVLLADVAVRKLGSVTSEASIEMVPGTDLIKITAKLPGKKLGAFKAYPASHVYLGVPSASRPNRKPLWYISLAMTSNPFTVASVDEEKEELTLVARQMHGPLTGALSRLASLRSPDSKFALTLDGPYGAAANFPDLAGGRFDKILLVAGGIGSTFILPLYEHVRKENPAASVEFIWAVRDIDEVSWLVASGAYSSDIVRLFLTDGEGKSTSVVADSAAGFDDVEMNRLEKEKKGRTNIAVEDHKRPNLERIVDGVFRHNNHEKVAVVVCGPVQMARDLRKAVGFWVELGRDVWFHNESFG